MLGVIVNAWLAPSRTSVWPSGVMVPPTVASDDVIVNALTTVMAGLTEFWLLKVPEAS